MLLFILLLNFLDDYYEEDMMSRERTFSEGSVLKGQLPPKDPYLVRRRNISPNSPSHDGFDDVNLDDTEAMSRHNTIPRGTNRHYMQESAPNIRRMSPRRPQQNYDP